MPFSLMPCSPLIDGQVIRDDEANLFLENQDERVKVLLFAQQVPSPQSAVVALAASPRALL